jgi:hypothetical protein
MLALMPSASHAGTAPFLSIEDRIMELSDGTRVCVDCTQIFTVDDGERRFFEARGFAMPKRCPTCRQARRISRERAQAQQAERD